MLDVHSVASASPTIYRKDYQPPDWLIPDVALDFALGEQETVVTSRLTVVRNGQHDRPLVLNGEELRLISVQVDGEAVVPHAGDASLTIPLSADSHEITIEVALSPGANTKLMGLYASGGILCTQCEAEGFRRITYFTDRPDVLSRYKVRMTADKGCYPVLLCNGDPVATGEEGGSHWAEWHDPFPKPCYLFALVAGDLKANQDRFITRSGKTVELGIWVAEADLPKTGHAMDSLKASMAWDEEVYGREYDLGIFNIVAVGDFNFGAMENKGLNVFNTSYVLADPQSATDTDFDNILGVVGHEYFHNWSGNRVTCRDWFQLSLKEGFTVFRDQSFSADQGSAAVKRIQDVRILRATQFPEDAGPLAHPVRPESFIEISNFYTSTIYNKGAEVIRMMHSLLGAERFRAGSDLYFERHDGQAVTCEDFVSAMEDASGEDFSQFRNWYIQAGTPKLSLSLDYETASGAASLRWAQSLPDTPGQSNKPPMDIPLKLAVFDRASGAHDGERIERLTERRGVIALGTFAQAPVLSVNRGFSAPIIIESRRSAGDLSFLAAHDDDPFARYEAMQQLMLDGLVEAVATGRTDHAPVLDAVQSMLSAVGTDPAFVAEALLLPSEAFIGDQMLVVDPDAIHVARNMLRGVIGRDLAPLWRNHYDALAQSRYVYTPEAKGARRLRAVALAYLMAGDEAASVNLAVEQFRQADNMTDRQAALAALASSDAAERHSVIADFYDQFRDNPLVIDKWFSTQALSSRSDTIDVVRALKDHPDFSLHNPNRVRSLIGAFAANQQQFNLASGEGYSLLASSIIDLDPINPQVAARQVAALGRWRRYDEARQGKMRYELERILAIPGLSKDVFEQASKSLD
jgi:aminopeptidase N